MHLLTTKPSSSLISDAGVVLAEEAWRVALASSSTLGLFSDAVGFCKQLRTHKEN